MSLFHDSIEWKKELAKLVSQLTPGENIPYSVLQDFLHFFNTPISTWKIPFAKKGINGEDKKIEEQTPASEITQLTEQLILEQTRHYLWSTFYQRLLNMEYEKGEVFHIQHLPLKYPEIDNFTSEEYPPHSMIYEGSLEGEHKFLRIWSVSLPNIEKFVYDEGESFTQYYEYAKLHVPKLDEYIHTEEDLYQVILAERERHQNEPYATVAGQRDVAPGSILYFYWSTHFFFSAELFLNEDSVLPYMCYNPHLYPYPVQYFHAKNFRKFRYLKEEL